MLNSAQISYWERKHFFDGIDLVVVGSGIVGYSTALHYKSAHPEAKILILERGILPSGASSKNAGFACFGSPTELRDDLATNDSTTVWDTVALRLEGLRYLEELLGKSRIDLQINGSWDLMPLNAETEIREICDILPDYNAELLRISGEKDVYRWDANMAQKFGFSGISGGFYNRLEGQLDTSKMNAAFYEQVIGKGISVLFGVEAREISDASYGKRIHTQIGEIVSQKVAICTNGFAKQFLPDDDIAPARAQVLITQPIADLHIKGTFHFQEGYYYFRNIDNRILFGGGRNLDVLGETTTSLDTSEQILGQLKSLLREVILPNTPHEIDHSWAGIMGVGKTKKPIIRMVESNVACGVRLGGMGVAIGTLVGKEVAHLLDSQ